MLELIFVIVVIGILSAIAVPKFAATRDDAVITKARQTVAAVRSALATERQKRILRGDFNNTLGTPAAGSDIFTIKWGTTDTKLLEYPVKTCGNGVTRECWKKTNTASNLITYQFVGPMGNTCTFDINGSRFVRSASSCNVPGLTDL